MRCIMLSNNNFDKDFARHKLVNIIEPNMKVVCIPFASDLKWLVQNAETELSYNGKFTLEQYKPFREYGIEQDNFYMMKPTDSRKYMKWKIDQADIIYFTGGKMENIKNTLMKMGLWGYIMKHGYNKIFIGVSAGALILQDEYWEIPNVDDCYKNFQKRNGFGFVENYTTLVHFDKYNENHVLNLITVSKSTGKIVIGIPEDGGIVVADDVWLSPTGNYQGIVYRLGDV